MFVLIPNFAFITGVQDQQTPLDMSCSKALLKFPISKLFLDKESCDKITGHRMFCPLKLKMMDGREVGEATEVYTRSWRMLVIKQELKKYTGFSFSLPSQRL